MYLNILDRSRSSNSFLIQIKAKTANKNTEFAKIRKVSPFKIIVNLLELARQTT